RKCNFAIMKNFMPKDTKTLGNNKAWACESRGFVHKKRLCQRFDTTSQDSSLLTINKSNNKFKAVSNLTGE
ncbi:hypothetical protein, partial [Parabacteroides goldsteinii]|uniref:hypothetical protein n=1 Tax=Parabacteroides goldsteinii TaxID=328812 RepID=UPI003AB52C3B